MWRSSKKLMMEKLENFSLCKENLKGVVLLCQFLCSSGIESIVKYLEKELNVRGYFVHFFHLSVLDIKKVAIKVWSGCNFSNFFCSTLYFVKGLKVYVEMKSVNKYKRRYTQLFSLIISRPNTTLSNRGESKSLHQSCNHHLLS